LLYRSHFGRFDFDGVLVEVMACLERREGDGWAPAQTSHAEMVMLDGAPICVSWLEEEALAYIRCGRLERAALCLPHCDYSRLFALLHGASAPRAL
jgi:hypothetical protein